MPYICLIVRLGLVAMTALALAGPPAAAQPQGPAVITHGMRQALKEAGLTLADLPRVAEAAGEGLSRNAWQIFTQAEAELLHTAPTLAEGAASFVKLDRSWQWRIAQRILTLTRQTGATGEALLGQLRRATNWNHLWTKTRTGLSRAGFVRLGVLTTFLEVVAVYDALKLAHFTTYAGMRAAYLEYLAEMDSLSDAADKEAFNTLLQQMFRAVAQGRHRLCEGLTLGQAARQLRLNMLDSANPARPFAGILYDCTRSTTAAQQPAAFLTLSGALDQRQAEKVNAHTGANAARMTLTGSGISLVFKSDPKVAADASSGTVDVAPKSITLTSIYDYRHPSPNELVDKTVSQCDLEGGRFLAGGEQKIFPGIVGAWQCSTRTTRNDAGPPAQTARGPLRLDWDARNKEWLLVFVMGPPFVYRMH